ncbi:tRNA G26 N,N-dimethylase Trm1 [Mucilaginibacter sp. HD30]
MDKFDHILLFKTNIVNKTDKRIIKLLKDAGVSKWHVDCEDCDKVLRIESSTLHHQTIINLLKNQGYECSELT